MISNLINRFKKTDEDELRAFQTRVLRMIRELYPEKTFSASNDPTIILLDSSQLGLTNIHSHFLLTDNTEASLREILEQYFSSIVDPQPLEALEIDWETAKKMLMPQLMPREFTTNIPLVFHQFYGDILLGFVLDRPDRYQYVTQSDLKNWGVSMSDIQNIALENLDARSRDMDMTCIEGNNALLMVGSGDGFDAVRIASQNIRQVITETIGCEFYFGVPNRDFLICWSANAELEFQEMIRGKIMHDSNEMPYPLCSDVLTFDAKWQIIPVEGKWDPRASSSVNN